MRVSKWDRPPPPKDWRWWVGNLGKTLIATGLLMFGFVAYQLWGTGIENAQAQNRLESEFEALLASVPGGADGTFGDGRQTNTPGRPATDATDASGRDVDPGGQVPPPGIEPDDDSLLIAPPTDQAPAVRPDVVIPADEQVLPPSLEDGDALARLEIPDIGVNEIVVAGVQTRDLKKGPGHFPDTPLPGQLGNAAIAGHRTTYGEPFFDVDKLLPGDPIVVTTLNGIYTYAVTGIRIVEPSEYSVVATTDPNRATLTLTSCHPKWTARQRIVVFSELISEASAPVGEPVLNYGRPDEPAPIDELPGDPDLPVDDVLGDAAPGDAAPGDAVAVDDPIAASDPLGNDDATATDVATDEVAPRQQAGSGGSGTVTGNLDDTPVGRGNQSVTATVDGATDASALGSAAVNAAIADAFSEGWFSDPNANPQVGMWGAILAAIGIGAYLLSRRLRRDWVGAAVAVLPFFVTLYFFFQNVNRLLPPHL